MNRLDAPPSMLPPWRLGAEAVARHYRLPHALAAELIAEQTQAALRRHWQAWVIVAVVTAVWLTLWQHGGAADTRLQVLLVGVASWQLVGRLLARRRIHVAACDKAARLAHPDISGWPQ